MKRLVVLLVGLLIMDEMSAQAKPAVEPQNVSHQGHGPADLEGRTWRISPYLHGELTARYTQLIWVPKPYIALEDGIVKGSPGCGQFSGSYRRSGAQLTLSVKWTDDPNTPCNAGERDDSSKMLEAFAQVRRVDAPPTYWHSDSPVLSDQHGKIQIALSPMQSGRDFSEFHDTYWHLDQMNGTTADLSRVVVSIGDGEITFSAGSYLISFPFGYELAGLQFSPAWHWDRDAKSPNYARDQQEAQIFENDLHAMSSYQLNANLSLLDKEGRAIMVLSPIRPTGIENRTWRIAKYREGEMKKLDEEGLVDTKSPARISLVNGRVDGSPGCGGWVGSYKLSGDQLEFDAGVVLAGLCERHTEVESRLVEKAFKAKMLIEQQDDRILLRDASGKAQVLLVPF